MTSRGNKFKHSDGRHAAADARDAAGAGQVTGSLTLDRGLRVLELLAASPHEVTVAGIAASLDLNRQAVYRVLKTLTEHRLAAPAGNGRYRLGVGVIHLAHMYTPHLQQAVAPHLRQLAEDTQATAHCAVADGDEAITLLVVEPANVGFHFSYRPGSRHALDHGASGIAILAVRPPVPGEREEVTRARQLGYAVTIGQITQGAIGIAAPLTRVRGAVVDASIGIVTIAKVDVEFCARRVMDAAAAITRTL